MCPWDQLYYFYSRGWLGSKKEWKRWKNEKIELTGFPIDKAKKAEEPVEEIPEVDESTVGQLSDEVRALLFRGVGKKTSMLITLYI